MATIYGAFIENASSVGEITRDSVNGLSIDDIAALLETDHAAPSVCHQCAEHVTFGDPGELTEITIDDVDQDGNPTSVTYVPDGVGSWTVYVESHQAQRDARNQLTAYRTARDANQDTDPEMRAVFQQKARAAIDVATKAGLTVAEIADLADIPAVTIRAYLRGQGVKAATDAGAL